MTTTEQRLADALRAILPFAERDVGELAYLACDDDSEDEAMDANADVERAREALAAYDAQQAATPIDSGPFVGGLHIELFGDEGTPDPETYGYALQSNGTRICDGLEEDHARRIAQCVNAHDGLVSALRTAREAAAYQESGEIELPGIGEEWMTAAHDALAAAGVQS